MLMQEKNKCKIFCEWSLCMDCDGITHMDIEWFGWKYNIIYWWIKVKDDVAKAWLSMPIVKDMEGIWDEWAQVWVDEMDEK